MIIQLFRTNRPAVYLLLLVFTLLLRGSFLLYPSWMAPQPDAYLGQLVSELSGGQSIPLIWQQAFDIFLIYIEAILFNFMVTAHGLFPRQTFIPALMFVTISSLFGEWIATDLQTIGQLFVIFSIYNLFTLTGKDLSRENILYTSLYLGIGSFFYFPVSYLLPVVLIGMILRGYTITEILLLLIGFLLPYYFAGIYMYYQGELDRFFAFIEMTGTMQRDLSLGLTLEQAGMLAYILLLCALGYLGMMSDPDFKVVRQRRLMLLVLAFLVLVLIAFPAVHGSKLLYFQMLVIPAAILSGRFFNRQRLRFYHHILFLLLLGGIAWFQLSYLHIV